MDKAWMARYSYGVVHVEEFAVVRASPKQVTLASGGVASGYRTRVGPEEVFTYEGALLEVMRQIEEEIQRTKAAMQAHEASARNVALRLAKLRTPAGQSSAT